MFTFISHSAKDNPAVSSFRAGLIGQGIKVWDPESMEAGALRSDQVRNAINSSDVCVFLATEHSIKDEWCMAEVGAFWGAGKAIIVYKLKQELEDDLLPPQLQGQFWRDNFDLLVRDIKKFIFEADEKRKREAARRPRMVSELTIATLYDALTSLRTTALDALPVSEAMRLIHETIFNNLADQHSMLPLIGRLVGVPKIIIEDMAVKYWPTPFRLITDSGEWLGFAKKFASYELTSEYSNCLLILCNATSCVAAITASTVAEREDKIFFDGLIENGSIPLGTPRQLSPRSDV